MKTRSIPAKTLRILAALLLAGSLAGCDAVANTLEDIDPEVGAKAGAPVPGSAASAANALVQLESIPLKGRAPKTGYSGCDTPNDIQARDLVDQTFKPGTNDRGVKCSSTHGRPPAYQL
jgi:hypothetical protein